MNLRDGLPDIHMLMVYLMRNATVDAMHTPMSVLFDPRTYTFHAREQQTYIEASRWIRSRNHNCLLDYETVCEYLGLKPQRGRTHLRRIEAVRRRLSKEVLYHMSIRKEYMSQFDKLKKVRVVGVLHTKQHVKHITRRMSHETTAEGTGIRGGCGDGLRDIGRGFSQPDIDQMNEDDLELSFQAVR
jgi:hypothetical protein